MWEQLSRVDWGRLCHAYGRAKDAPSILRNMFAPEKAAREEGWSKFWGAINHQGDYYDSTVALIPFLIEAVAHPALPMRRQVLTYFRDKWLDAPNYSGDPLAPEPPGGINLPTPLLCDGAPAAKMPKADEEITAEDMRRMDLCAWQTGQAIYAGRSIYLKLLDDADGEVVQAAASLLQLWPETRAAAQRALVRLLSMQADELRQAACLLDFGVYATSADLASLEPWLDAERPPVVRAAAALVRAWVANPEAVPEPAASALRETTAPDCKAFAQLPHVGLFHAGTWGLPDNLASLILRLAMNEDKEIRWRATQGIGKFKRAAKLLSPADVVPVLATRLSDAFNRIRDAAAYALADLGEAALEVEPNLVPLLLQALQGHKSASFDDRASGLDSDASVCGHAARLLAALAHRLTPDQRQQALAAIQRAARRYAGKNEEYVMFNGMWLQAAPYLEETAGRLAAPPTWDLPKLLELIAFPDREDLKLPVLDADQRLAKLYAASPQTSIAAAVQLLLGERNQAVGAAHWLRTLGPAAAPALEVLDQKIAATGPPWESLEFKDAAKAIRHAVDLANAPSTPRCTEVESQIEALAKEPSTPPDAALLLAALPGYLSDPDARVRARGADLARQAAPAATPEILAALMRLLADEAAVEVGIEGRHECAGRLYHWRIERRSPRVSAIHALYALRQMPGDPQFLAAMLAEAMQPDVICGKSAVPQRFPLPLWRAAAEAAGGLRVAEPQIRAVCQRLRNFEWDGTNAAHVCAEELSDILRQLSGRLV